MPTKRWKNLDRHRAKVEAPKYRVPKTTEAVTHIFYTLSMLERLIMRGGQSKESWQGSSFQTFREPKGGTKLQPKTEERLFELWVIQSYFSRVQAHKNFKGHSDERSYLFDCFAFSGWWRGKGRELVSGKWLHSQLFSDFARNKS